MLLFIIKYLSRRKKGTCNPTTLTISPLYIHFPVSGKWNWSPPPFQPIRAARVRHQHQWAMRIAPGFWILLPLSPPPSLDYKGPHIFCNEWLCIKTLNLHKALGKIHLVSSDLVYFLLPFIKTPLWCPVIFDSLTFPSQTIHFIPDIRSYAMSIVYIWWRGEENLAPGDKHYMGRLNTSKEGDRKQRLLTQIFLLY